MQITRWLGEAKSRLIYDWKPFQQYRMRSLYSQILNSGDLAFDVGSHTGNRIRCWRSLGAKVIGIEPQPRFFDKLEREFRADDNVRLVQAGLSDREGMADLHICHSSPTLSTFATDWIEEAKTRPIFKGIEWNETIQMPLMTLDQLIEVAGLPKFIKIDVEGLELAVLNGLTQPARALL